MNERKITVLDSTLLRIEVTLGVLINLNCQLLAKANDQDFDDLYAHVLGEIQKDWRKAVQDHSNLGGSPQDN